MSEVEVADVTVVTPAWRAAGTIGRALTSVARQTVRPREVIVVDDGSDDGTSEAARAFADALAPTALKVIRQENAGPGAARNRAIAEASGAILAFLDADDEWLPEKLEVSLAVFSSQPAVLVAHNMIVQDGETTARFDCARHLTQGMDGFAALYKRGFVATATVLCRRTAATAAGGFDRTLRSGQDYELWLRIARDHPCGVVLLPDYLTRYHVVPGSVSSKVGLRRRCSLEIARRHAPALRGRTRFPAGVAALRVAIVTAEAVLAYRRKRDWLSATAVVAALPWALAATLAALLSGSAREGGTA